MAQDRCQVEIRGTGNRRELMYDDNIHNITHYIDTLSKMLY